MSTPDMLSDSVVYPLEALRPALRPVEDQVPGSRFRRRRPLRAWIYDILLIYVLLAGVFFRVSGLFWGENQYLHPDERFLVWVGSDISPVKSLGEYFDTANSSLNPQNRGHGFYVYGTLPMFITRYAVEWIYGHSGFDEMTQVGRTLSTVADLSTVLLVYLVAKRLYDRRVGLLAAAFSAATVLQIQQSHFFTMDTFINAFSFLAFYFAVRVMTEDKAWRPSDEDQPGQKWRVFKDPLLVPSLLFGLALGMAVASKLNAAPMALALPAAMLVGVFRMPEEQRQKRAFQAFLFLALAAFVSVLAFRIFQPYAFSGPGFFGLKPNPAWVANIRELSAQSGGDNDMPPNMQWARRPVWFSLQNMVVWGLGLPLGLLAWAGFLWTGWRLFNAWRRRPSTNGKRIHEWEGAIHNPQSEIRLHPSSFILHPSSSSALLWGWTAIYFAWQSLARNPTMRYQLPIYPTLAIFAAWAIIALYDWGKQHTGEAPQRSIVRFWAITAILGGSVVLIATYAYAYAFSQIYVRPITRLEASRWIYQNVPAPVNLHIQTPDGVFNQPLSFPYNSVIAPGAPYTVRFEPKVAGTLTEIYLPAPIDQRGQHELVSLHLAIRNTPDPTKPLATATLSADLTPSVQSASSSVGFTLTLDRAIELKRDLTYTLSIELTSPAEAPGESSAVVLTGELSSSIQTDAQGDETAPIGQLLNPPPGIIRAEAPYVVAFTPLANGALTHLSLTGGSFNDDGSAYIPGASPSQAELRLSLEKKNSEAEAERSPLIVQANSDSAGGKLVLEQPLQVVAGEEYNLRIELLPTGGLVVLRGAGLANEGDWDDGLPMRVEGYDGFGGIYPPGLNFNMYWDDNPDKLARFERILNQADFIAISSNRQWGSLTRIPERFPMTTLYYRNLLGCPPEQDIIYCYRIAQPGTYQGKLGYELVQIFESPPSLGPLTLNDQFAEEAFTVYDHPKVFIFKKTTDYNPERVHAVLGAVDFSQVVRTPPMRLGSQPATLLLPDDRLAEQRQGGAWSELFNSQALQNRSQPLAVLLWYVCVSILGWMVYPLLRLALPGLEDRAYPLARTAGLLLLSYLVWIAGSMRIPFTRLTITIALGFMLVLCLILLLRQRLEILDEVRRKRTYFLLIELLTLAFFLAFLMIRVGNPDLWHPWKGGEKPMDFSYFNAVLKSSSFPPYDPWYAGGYLNYYYYGFVMVGVLVKWLGIVPSIAYNLILPTLFSLMAMGAFSLAWNLSQGDGSRRTEDHASGVIQPPGEAPPSSVFGPLSSRALIPALSASFGLAVLGNLGTVRMIFQGWQKLVAPGGVTEGASLLTRWTWAARGLLETIKGAHLPYSLGDWYWIPSRAIPAPNDVEPITEFPFFTALYADLHAHLMALPITLLALAFAIGVVLGCARWKERSGAIAWFLLAGLSVGALRPTNTWDFPVFLVLVVLALGFALWGQGPMQAEVGQGGYETRPYKLTPTGRIARILGAVVVLVILAFVLFQPYAEWYKLGYTKVSLWEGTRTPPVSYLTHWGLFLFVIVSWMVQETLDWLDQTPLSALRKLTRFQYIIQVFLAALLVMVGGLLWYGIRIAWLALPLAAWAGILLLRPGRSNAQKMVLFMVGTGLVLTLMVEIIVLSGDIGRMNTVFKFYLQVWTLFAISAAAALGWTVATLPRWSAFSRNAWQIVLTLFVAGAALYPFMAGMAKIEDRITENAPHTLDGMAYMPYAEYTDEWGTMDLAQDYRAIRWMQENVPGSPVIVEANLRNLYRWGSRYTIYTGLPGVVGWEWHQQQQRAANPGTWVSARIAEIDEFYLTTDWEAAQAFLRKYDVRYIIVGQQERGHYPGLGLNKFEDADGILWLEVYRDGETVIYETLDQ